MKKNEREISRKDFVRLIGAGTALAFLYPCMAGLSGCTKIDNPIPPVDLGNIEVDFTLDLSLTENSALLVNNGYVIIDNEFVVAKDENGSFIAASRLCSHEPHKRVVWWSDTSEWVCEKHYASFTKEGAGTSTFNNTYGSSGLKTYNTQLINSQTLRVYG